jgi:hypothetical protein
MNRRDLALGTTGDGADPVGRLLGEARLALGDGEPPGGEGPVRGVARSLACARPSDGASA